MIVNGAENKAHDRNAERQEASPQRGPFVVLILAALGLALSVFAPHPAALIAAVSVVLSLIVGKQGTPPRWAWMAGRVVGLVAVAVNAALIAYLYVENRGFGLMNGLFW